MFSLNKELIKIDGHFWTAKSVCEDCETLSDMALSFFKNNYGGIVFCSESDEKDTWLSYARETNRINDVSLLSQETFNFLSYELDRKGKGVGQIESIADIFGEIIMSGTIEKYLKCEKGMIRDPLQKLLRYTMILLSLTKEVITLTNIKRVVESTTLYTFEEDKLGYCYNLIYKMAEEDYDTDSNKRIEAALTKDYFTYELPKIQGAWASNLRSKFYNIFDNMLKGELLRCFSAEKSSLSIESIYEEGKVLIVDYDLENCGKVGEYGTAIIKSCFQRAIDRKDIINGDNLPVFMFIDKSPIKK